MSTSHRSGIHALNSPLPLPAVASLIESGTQAKLAPALIHDLHLHDPDHPPYHGLNILRDAPSSLSGVGNLANLLTPQSCRHSWFAKDQQNVQPGLDSRPSPGLSYQFAAVCRHCRVRLLLHLTYPAVGESDFCPTPQRPLHHFLASSSQNQLIRQDRTLTKQEQYGEIVTFACSSLRCAASLEIRLQPPRLTMHHIQLLTDRTLLSNRTEEVISSQPARFLDRQRPLPVDVLTDLRQILQNVFEHGESKPIRGDNKRFSLRFGLQGQPCKELLESLGFKYEVDLARYLQN